MKFQELVEGSTGIKLSPKKGDIDRRDHLLKHDPSVQQRVGVLKDVLKRLQEAEWFAEEKAEGKVDVSKLVSEALEKDESGSSVLGESDIMDLIEFGRSVHAEMAALMDAARRGVSVKDCKLYTTTFPCHLCAKHIVASGIDEVVYIEPYPKSRVHRLYPDSINVESPQGASKGGSVVRFNAFVGVSPWRYMGLFRMTKRKTKDGALLKWGERSEPHPIFWKEGYTEFEKEYVDKFNESCKTKGLKKV